MRAASILVAEDERSMREFLEILLRRQGYEVAISETGEDACRQLDQREFDVVITDLKMPGVGGMEVLEHCKRVRPASEVIMVTAFATTDTAIRAMKMGAYDYLTKPFKVDEILVTVERALEKRKLVQDNAALRQRLSDRFHLDGLIGRSPGMLRVFELVRKVAATRSSVLISGESGTGKELVARAIHAQSDRREASLVAINCGAVPESLMESELFGHVKGAFTGAASDKPGLFVAADGGTLFLDEIGELSQAMQVALLRVLQERKVKPVGGVRERKVDVRVLAATNRDLEEEVQAGRFRSDLYYRLNVIPLQLPPLRERREDIPLLAEHFIQRYALEMGRSEWGVTPEAMSLLCKHHYPGNVRELENVIERALALTSAPMLDVDSLPGLQREPPATATTLPAEGIDLDEHISTIERDLLIESLGRTSGNRSEAARLLGISLRSMRYRLAKYGIEVDD